MKPAFEYGDEVRLIRNVRNDGTYPGKEIGDLLLRRGSIGCVYDVGTYLQDQLIYRVNFIDEGKTVGCREEELIRADDPWIQNAYEFNERVLAKISLAVSGEVVVPEGKEGTVMKVLRDEEDEVIRYHVNFGNGRMFVVPESALNPIPSIPQESASSES